MWLFKKLYLEIIAAYSDANQEVTTKKALGFDPTHSDQSDQVSGPDFLYISPH